MRKLTTSDRLKQIMDERKIKQIDILERCKPYCKKYGVQIKKNDLSQYVSGKVEPRQDKLSILSLALNVSEPWLMGYDVPRKRHENLEQNCNSNKTITETQLLNQIEQFYNSLTSNLVSKFSILDNIDQAKVVERTETLLESEKYLKKDKSLNGEAM